MENLLIILNIFRMLGIYIVSKTMIILSVRVIKEWRIYENEELEKNIIIKVFFVCIIEKEIDLSKEKVLK